MDYNGHDTGKFVFDGIFSKIKFTKLTSKFFISAWRKQFPDNPAFKSSKTVEQFNKEGKLGRKSGEGFYKYK